MPHSLQFVVGHTYKALSRREAPLDRSGQFSKIHDWVLYVDVVDAGNPDILEKVTFDLGESFEPKEYICHCPIPIAHRAGRDWRFQTRQTTYGMITAKVILRGRGGSRKVVHYDISTQPAQELPLRTFEERRPLRPFRPLKLPDMVKFGMELELSCASNVYLKQIAKYCSASQKPEGTIHVVDSYSEGRQAMSCWKIVPDSSIQCNRSQPDCRTLELVSPPLQGGDGLSTAAAILQKLHHFTHDGQIKVNKSMGFHLHVDVSSLTLSQLIKVCQNFVKYEDAIDSLVPPSRRTGSEESQEYFRTHKGIGYSNQSRHAALASCTSLIELAGVMNPNGRYHKLNLQNLVSGRQPTLEFRQHSATANYEKVSQWVRLCAAIVRQSARLAAPKSFRESGKSIDEQVEALFCYVIKDRALRDYYQGRRQELQTDMAANSSSSCGCGDQHSLGMRCHNCSG